MPLKLIPGRPRLQAVSATVLWPNTMGGMPRMQQSEAEKLNLMQAAQPVTHTSLVSADELPLSTQSEAEKLNQFLLNHLPVTNNTMATARPTSRRSTRW